MNMHLFGRPWSPSNDKGFPRQHWHRSTVPYQAVFVARPHRAHSDGTLSRGTRYASVALRDLLAKYAIAFGVQTTTRRSRTQATIEDTGAVPP
jgi:hypothetical protein